MEKVLIILFLILLPVGNLTVLWKTVVPFPPLHELVLVAILIHALFVHRIRLFSHALSRPVALIGGAMAISLVANAGNFSANQLFVSALYGLRWLLYAGLFFVVSKSKYQRLWVNGLFWAGVIFAVLGFLQFSLYPNLRNLEYLEWDPHYYRMFSTLLDPNFLGLILVITFFLGMMSKRHPALQLLLLLAIYLTYSRSTYLALGMGLVAQRKFEKYTLAGIGFFLLLLVFLPRLGGDILRLDRAASTQARIINWQEGADLFRKSPVFGWGFNTLRFVAMADPTSHAAGGVDNSFLFVLVTTGVIGALAFGNLFVRLFTIGGPTFTPILTSIFIHSLFINSLFYPWVMVYLWVFAGSIGGRRRSVRL